MSKLTLAKAAVASVFVVAILAVAAPVACGVTPALYTESDADTRSVTTGAAVRARADVQIRRIKSLIVTQSAGDEADYERLEKLQKDLRGER